SDAAERDLVLIYFATHGCPEITAASRNPRKYLVSFDTKWDNIYGTAIDFRRDVVDWLDRIPSNRVFVALDTCFSGAAGGRGIVGPKYQIERDEIHSFQPRLDPLEDQDLGQGRLVFTACREDEVATEDTEFRHGTFSYYLFCELAAEDRTEANIPALA